MQLTTTTVLALGTAGAQGSGLLDALAARGARAVRVTSDPARAEAWRADGHAVAVADLTDPASLRRRRARDRRRGGRAARPARASARPTGWRPSSPPWRPCGTRGPCRASTPAARCPTRPPRTRPAGGRWWAPWPARGRRSSRPPPTWRTTSRRGRRDRSPQGELLYPRPAEDVVAWVAARDVTAAAVAALVHDRTGEVVRLAGPAAAHLLRARRGAGRRSRPDGALPRGRAAGVRATARAVPRGATAPRAVAGFYAAMPRTPEPSLSPDVGEVWRDARASSRRAPGTWAAEVLAPALRRPASR